MVLWLFAPWFFKSVMRAENAVWSASFLSKYCMLYLRLGLFGLCSINFTSSSSSCSVVKLSPLVAFVAVAVRIINPLVEGANDLSSPRQPYHLMKGTFFEASPCFNFYKYWFKSDSLHYVCVQNFKIRQGWTITLKWKQDNINRHDWWTAYVTADICEVLLLLPPTPDNPLSKTVCTFSCQLI